MNQEALIVDRRGPVSMSLAVETLVVTTGAIGAITLLHARGSVGPQWLTIPAVLVMAALVPAWIAGRDFPHIGLHLDQAGLAVGTLGPVCVYALLVAFLSLWVLTLLSLPLPLRPIVPQGQSWCAWLVYQFLYVAVAEEVFFRGYVQANTMRLLSHCGLGRTTDPNPPSAIRHPQCLITMFVSAACFALAHVVVQGQITSLLTFLPGLILAWLFLRTGSLLAPILFHGLANVSYAVMAMTLVRS
jgi:membrane protease YdiL (CAAX protease family)